MALANRTIFCACLYLASATAVHAPSNQFIPESNLPMNQPFTKNYQATDKRGAPINITWQETTFFAPTFATLMKQSWPMAQQAYLPIEMNFLRAFPEVVQTEPYFNAFKPLFAQGVQEVDWTTAEKEMTSLLEKHFVFDPAAFSNAMIEQYEKDSVFMWQHETKKPTNYLVLLHF
jgi:hypothetical protein